MTTCRGRLQMESEAALREAQKAAEADRLHALEADYEATLARLESSMQQAEQQSALQVRPALPLTHWRADSQRAVRAPSILQ